MKRSLATAMLAVLMATTTLAAQRQVVLPADDIGVSSLSARRDAQLASASELRAFHDFNFTDRVVESGITFRHQVVDDAAKTYKAAHYDHGSGLAVADVDGDGRLDLYFVTQLGGNELWRNLGGGKFENITTDAIALTDRVVVGASFADIDNDGDPDLFTTSVRGGNALFRNDGAGQFTDITEASGVGYVGHSSGATFLDYDGDGLLDLFVTNVGDYTLQERGDGFWLAREDAFRGHLMPERNEQSILYRNLDGTHFVDVSSATGLVDTSWSGDATVVDFNRDGFPDLYVTSMQGDDHYYVNNAGRGFAAQTARVFPRTPWGAMGIQSFDFDNDGAMDLFLTDMHSDMSAEVGPELETTKPQIENAELFYQDSSNNILGNAFWHNAGDGTFTERSDELGLENFWPWGTSADDINADGYQDVFIASSMNYPFRYHINSMLLNEGGESFAAAEFILGVEPRADGATHTPWFTLECGGADAEHGLCAGVEEPLVVMGTLGTRTSALIDIDNDGDLDIITGEFGSAPQILVSNLSEQRTVNWLKVKLVGTFSNRDAIGSYVTVSAGDLQMTRFVDGKTGYLTQSSLPLYFGLDDATTIDRITVTWPSGGEQVLEGPMDANVTLTIEEK